MSLVLKEKVRALVDELPEEELKAAHRYLQYLRDVGSDPYVHLDQDDDLEEKDQEELHQSIVRGLKQARSGMSRPAADFLADLKNRD